MFFLDVGANLSRSRLSNFYCQNHLFHLQTFLVYFYFDELLSYAYFCNSNSFFISDSCDSLEMISNLKNGNFLLRKISPCLMVRCKGTLIRLMTVISKRTLKY